MRIVSLLPSATEVVHALGRGDELVGRSEECDHPLAVRSLPVVMRAKTLDADRSSAEIDARVRATRGASESLYRLDLDLLARLAPDLLLTQDLCGVCSVTESEVHEACQRSGIAPRVVSLSPRTLDEVWETFRTIGREIGSEAAGEELRERARRRARPGRAIGRPTVAVVEWLDPPILAGLWAPDIVASAGGRALGPDPGQPGLRTSWDAIARLAPTLIVIAPCSFPVDRTRTELAAIPARATEFLSAPPLGAWIADEAYFSRPGPRLADGVDLIADLLDGRTPRAGMPVTRVLGVTAS